MDELRITENFTIPDVKPKTPKKDCASSEFHRNGISAALSTDISHNKVSGQIYITRELNVIKAEPQQTRQLYHEAFQQLSQRELHFQDLMLDLSLTTFCRLSQSNSTIILECGANCQQCLDSLRDMTLTPEQAAQITYYLANFHRKTCSMRNRPVVEMNDSKFRHIKQRTAMARLLFDEPLNELKSSNKDGHLNTLFSDPVFTQNIRAIRDDYANVAVFTLIHNNYRPENIILRPPTSSCGSMVVYGAEMCMFGNPSYDLGVLIGSLLIWHHIHMLNPDRHEERRLFCHNLEQCILDMCDSYFEELHGVPEPVTPKFMYYVAGFAACEIFFRLSKNNWAAEKLDLKENVRADLLQCAARLILKKNEIDTPNKLLMIALMLC